MKFKNYYFWIAAIASITIDILSKQAVVRNLQLQQPLPLIPNVLNFTYIRNTGAAFSLFQGHEWLKWLSLVVTLVLISIGLVKSFSSIWEQVGLGLILAGAAGNGIDRLFFGSVVDFIDIRLINFAIFNWADASINIGIACLLIHNFFDRSPRANSR
jgi:signal peptidase II